MSVHRCSSLIAILSLAVTILHAQENIPIGTFRVHASFNSIHDISFDGMARTFAAAPHGIMVVDRAHNETNTFTKANGISGGSITSIAFDAGTRKLVVAYAEGYVDVLNEDQSIGHFDPADNA